MGVEEDLDALLKLTAELEHKHASPAPALVTPLEPVQSLAQVPAYAYEQPVQSYSFLQSLVQYLPYEHQAIANQLLYYLSAGWKSAIIAGAIALAAAIYSGTVKLPSWASICPSTSVTAPLAPVVAPAQH